MLQAVKYPGIREIVSKPDTKCALWFTIGYIYYELLTSSATSIEILKNLHTVLSWTESVEKDKISFAINPYWYPWRGDMEYKWTLCHSIESELAKREPGSAPKEINATSEPDQKTIQAMICFVKSVFTNYLDKSIPPIPEKESFLNQVKEGAKASAVYQHLATSLMMNMTFYDSFLTKTRRPQGCAPGHILSHGFRK